MFILAFLAGAYCIITAIIGKGKAFRTKMGTPLPEREAKAVRNTYLIVGVLLILVGIYSTIQFFTK